ncbi:MAG: hypothetical protein HY077_19140 [Elusimicrobia bacterium]|nr:hypothetical protein [Elusimicrobiota bacterium]
MKYSWVLAVDRDDPKAYRLKLPGRRARKVVTVGSACRALKRSRRQLYRTMKEGGLKPCGKFLGEWLLDASDVERLNLQPAKVHRLPASLNRFFPEYQGIPLNPGRDRTVVLSRLLDQGGLPELRWVFRRYRKPEIARFLVSDGARLLSPRARRFWELFFNISLPEKPWWRGGHWAQGGAV